MFAKLIQSRQILALIIGIFAGSFATAGERPTEKFFLKYLKETKAQRAQHLYRTLTPLSTRGKSRDDHVVSGGDLSPLEAFYDVISYDISLRVDPDSKSIAGTTDITVKSLASSDEIQFDLLNSLAVSQIQLVRSPTGKGLETLGEYSHQNDVIKIKVPMAQLGEYVFRIEYSGVPMVAANPPWVGGFTWARTEQNDWWIGLSCEGEGSKIWFPSKDHPSDEANHVDLRITVPKGLFVAANGLLISRDEANSQWSTFHWRTDYPINNYAINFTAGKFDQTQSQFEFEGQKVPVVFYGLMDEQSTDYIEGDFRTLPEKKWDLVNFGIQYLDFFSRNFGMYPFANEKMGYVHTPYYGMEHQTAIAYGAGFKSQYTMDYIAFHELAHEWWGNKITAKDWADVWIHEGLAAYSEALYFEQKFDNPTYWKYLNAAKTSLANQKPVIGQVNSNTDQLDVGDIYNKSANILAIFREMIGKSKFLEILKDFASTPAGVFTKEVTTQDFLNVVEKHMGQSYQWFFDIYMRRAELPLLKYQRIGSQVFLRWDVGAPFPLPVTLDFIDSGKRRRVTSPMTNNEGVIDVGSGDSLQVARLYNKMIRLEKVP